MNFNKALQLFGIAVLAGNISTEASALEAGDLFTLNAQTTDESFCKKYASSAVAAYFKNTSLKCGFSGDRWTADFTGHYNWCLQQDTSSPINETSIRNDELSKCKSAAAVKIKPEMPIVKFFKPKQPSLPLKNLAGAGSKPNVPTGNDPKLGINLNLNFGSSGAPSQLGSGVRVKKFHKPMYKGTRLDFCSEDNQGCGQDAADAFCEDKGFEGAKRFSKARGRGPGFDTIQIGTGDANDNEPASAFKSITCEQ